MKSATLAACVAVIGIACGGAAVAFDDLAAVAPSLRSGRPDLDLRLRYENVNQANLDDAARAFTLRTRLGYTTGKWNALDAQVQLENVTAIGADHFNSTDNGRSRYPVVADPDGSGVSQAWIRYSGLPMTAIKFGRQRLVYDNARFVGDVGWRQHLQTYDGVTLTGTWLPKLTFNYAYLYNVNSFRSNLINGINTRNIGLKASQLFNLNYAPAAALSITAYAYLLDFKNDAPLPPAAGAAPNNPRRDTATYGARAGGTVPLGGFKLGYAAEYAYQQGYRDAASAPIHAGYYLAELGAARGPLNARLGYEVLQGDGHYGFQTPLATLHSFQGWADQFLTTPAAGIRDLYFGAGGTVEKAAIGAVWHDFESDDPSAAHYGSELDAQITRPLGKGFAVGTKYARYYPDHYPAASGKTYGTAKYWLWLEFRL
ncbi:MAG: alginate export family protein [Nevskia sp.]|nr:alginate export family protein [Nevskia sp.]